MLSAIESMAAGRWAVLMYLLAGLWLTSQPVEAAPKITAQQLQNALAPLAAAHAGEVAVSVQVLDAAGQTTLRWDLHGDRVMPTASLIKLPIMIEAYRQAAAGDIDLESMLTLKEEDKVPGSGILTEHFSAGLQLSLRDAIRLMIRYSDNTATNLVIDQIGIAATARTMMDWGFPETQLHSQVFRRETSVALSRSEKYGLGSTTANDMTELLARLERGELVSPEGSQEMLEHLFTCDDTHKLTRDLPSDCRVAHKTGSVNRSRTAAGIVSTANIKFAICVLTDNNEDSSWSPENAADVLIGAIARHVYDLVAQAAVSQAPTENAVSSPAAASSAKDSPPVEQVLKIGSVGDAVETLQRTLNERLDADLSVDGDFGPATEQAVRQFQERQMLTVNGVVEPETWQALQPLVDKDPPVPSPAEFNNRQSPRTAPLDPTGPPAVSAKAWAILDAASGRLLKHDNGEQRLPMASTTKVMTALLVLELAAADPSVLDEKITFSTRADETIGSTAGVRAGETLTAGELLYGLLLPSGNDASVALAEHFGPRLAGRKSAGQSVATSGQAAEQETPATGGGKAAADPPAADDGVSQFVAAMNSRAAELELSQTHFANPNGLSASDHVSSAQDLAQLARATLKYPLMRQIMQSRQHGVTARDRDGQPRNLLWENTYRLLEQTGFSGMKTGTTDAAGACLIAIGGDNAPLPETIVVLLGCSSSEARYIDARNLFGWAWRQ